MLDTFIILRLWIAPAEDLMEPEVIPTDLFFGIKMYSIPNANADLEIEPKLWGSCIPSSINIFNFLKESKASQNFASEK